MPLRKKAALIVSGCELLNAFEERRRARSSTAYVLLSTDRISSRFIACQETTLQDDWRRLSCLFERLNGHSQSRFIIYFGVEFKRVKKAAGGFKSVFGGLRFENRAPHKSEQLDSRQLIHN